jgi:predicted secreted protein
MKIIAFIVLILCPLSISCQSTATIKIEGNESVGDGWESAITPEGVVREVSSKYRVLLPFPGMGGTFTFKFRAVAEGEAEIVLTHYFRGRKTHWTTYAAVVDGNKRLTLTVTGTQVVDDEAEMRSKLRGTWYAPDEKIAIRFLEDVIQVALDVENIEDADFSDYATYTVERYGSITITTRDASANAATAALLHVNFYQSPALDVDYLRVSYDSRRDGFLAGFYIKQETGGAEGGE